MSDDFYQKAKDVPTGFRLCSRCKEVKPVSEFFKDGFDAENNQRYRRDCKACYKLTRHERPVPKKRKLLKTPFARTRRFIE